MHDPISDMLTRIRNAQRANKVAVAMPSSKLKCAIAEVLKQEGYIEEYAVSADAKPVLEIQLKYYAGRPVIEQIKRVSRPGLRVYKGSSDIPTVMNGLALQDALEARGMYTRVQTAIEMRQIAEPYIKRKALKHLERGRIVIFSCGTGNPYFTTDTTAALREAEMEADVIIVEKTIDGVYSADPKVDTNAIKYDKITYVDILNKDLKVMDSTATSLLKGSGKMDFISELNQNKFSSE